MNSLSKSLTTTCEVLGMLHYASNKSTVSFSQQWKDILIEASRIAGKIGHLQNEEIQKKI